MGCLKFIVSSIFKAVVGIALIMFFMFGGLDYLKGLVFTYLNPPNQNVSLEASKIANFASVPKSYRMEKAVNVLGVKAVVANNKSTAQKVAVVEPGWVANITKEDIKSDKIDTQLKNIAKRLETPAVKLVNLETTQKGTFKAFGQNVPYVRVRAGVSGSKAVDYDGIIAVATGPDKKNIVLVSYGEPGKYQQIQAEKFFGSIKFNEK